MAKRGRKNFGEEVNIVRRYAELSEPYFEFIREMFESDSVADKKWAAEQLKMAYTKMIPQEVGGIGGGAIEIKMVNYASEE